MAIRSSASVSFSFFSRRSKTSTLKSLSVLAITYACLLYSGYNATRYGQEVQFRTEQLQNYTNHNCTVQLSIGSRVSKFYKRGRLNHVTIKA
eukprot:6487306-Amphidinium_carterae.1